MHRERIRGSGYGIRERRPNREEGKEQCGRSRRLGKFSAPSPNARMNNRDTSHGEERIVDFFFLSLDKVSFPSTWRVSRTSGAPVARVSIYERSIRHRRKRKRQADCPSFSERIARSPFSRFDRTRAPCRVSSENYAQLVQIAQTRLYRRVNQRWCNCNEGIDLTHARELDLLLF